MNNGAAMLEAKSVSEETITPGHYVKLSAKDKAKIKSVEIVAPKLGDSHFGRILVRYKSPIYKIGG